MEALVYHACHASYLLLSPMDAGLQNEAEEPQDENQRRLRSRTTPPATTLFAMSNSLDSGVGSFEESDIGEKYCSDEQSQHVSTIAEQSENQPDGGAKSFRFIYLGSAVLDKRYTLSMLPWVIAEVKRRRERASIDLNVEAMIVKAVDCSSRTTLFQHNVQTITRYTRSTDKKCFSYLTRIPEEVSSCYCYVFEAVESAAVSTSLRLFMLTLN